MAIAKQLPVFILLISIVGPILEEYIFRKVIFGEIYNKIKGNRIVAFLIASIVSSILFAIITMLNFSSYILVWVCYSLLLMF